MDEVIVDIKNLSKEFGVKSVLDNVNLSITKGVVYGLVGENGTGKTTLMKHILGLLRPSKGSVQVFGLDPVKNPEAVLSRIGYLSENRELIDWMRLDELIGFTRAFYPDWDDEYANHLVNSFGLNKSSIVGTLSRGQRAQVGLILAVSHHPDLLLLDEPSTGLDPIVRKDILVEIIHAVTERGQTVFFSSHLLEEVERMSDCIAMIYQGKVVLSGSLDEIKQNHKVLVLGFDNPVETLPSFSGVFSIQGSGKEWTILCDANFDQLNKEITEAKAGIIEQHQPSLTEIFIAHAGDRRNRNKSEKT